VLAGGLRKEGRTAGDAIDRVAQRAGPMSRRPGHPPARPESRQPALMDLVFRVTNTAAIQHDFSIKGRTTRKLSHGQSATLRVTFLRKGNYPYKCTVDHHASLGMKGVFTIT
jgi:hypothetical protein